MYYGQCEIGEYIILKQLIKTKTVMFVCNHFPAKFNWSRPWKEDALDHCVVPEIILNSTYGGKRTSINHLKRWLPGEEQLQALEILFQRLLSIVYMTLSFNLNSIIVILSGIIVEKTLFDRLQRLQNRAARVFLDMMLMSTAYLDNLIGKKWSCSRTFIL